MLLKDDGSVDHIWLKPGEVLLSKQQQISFVLILDIQ